VSYFVVFAACTTAATKVLRYVTIIFVRINFKRGISAQVDVFGS
jgi:hypothetical protein